MKQKQYVPYVLGILAVEAVGLLAALLTRSGTEYFAVNVTKPPLTPPAWVFPVVWTVLYALMGVGAVRIRQAPESEPRSDSLNLFAIQLALNFFWPLVFFNARAYGLAVVWVLALWVAVLWMILKFRKVDTLAAWLQVPYLVWLTLATYLTLGVWILN